MATWHPDEATVKDASIYATPPFDRLAPVTAAYATAPVLEGFNWREILTEVASGRWYLVVFRSFRTEDPNEQVLTAHDDIAFADALAGGGLLRYYRGEMDAGRNCLSLCVWQTRRQAQDATLRADHRSAASLTRRFYVWYDVERYVMTKRKGSPDPALRSVGEYRHQPSGQEIAEQQVRRSRTPGLEP